MVVLLQDLKRLLFRQMLLLKLKSLEIGLMPVTHDLALKKALQAEELVGRCYDGDLHNDEPLLSKN